MSETYELVVVSGGTSDPSSTKLLADRVAQRVAAIAERRGAAVRARVIELRELATDITTALTSQLITPKRSRRSMRWAPPTGSSPPPRSTRRARAGCSRRSSTCSTTTC